MAFRRRQKKHNRRIRKNTLAIRAHNKSDSDKNIPPFQAVVIGGGPSGAYAVRRLRKRFPGGRILLLEKTSRIGGRLLSGYEVSNQREGAKVYDELGGMRIFTDLMTTVVDAVQETECSLVHVPLDQEADNLFYFQGVRYKKSEFRVNNLEVPTLLGRYIQTFKQDTGFTGDDYHDSDIVRNLSAREFMLKYGGDDAEITALLSYGGYDAVDDLYHAAVVLDDEVFYTGGDLSAQHHFVDEGYSTVIKRLVSRSNVEVKLEATASGISRDVQGRLVVRFGQGGESHSAVTSNVFVCAPPEVAKTLLPEFVSPQRRAVLERLASIPLFKCFLHWDDQPSGESQWWHQLGYTRGKHTTDLPLRMVWNYDKNDLLIYNSGWTADGWKKEIDEKGIDQVARDMVDLLSEMFGVEVPPPNYDKTLWKHWPDGVAAWLPGTDVPSDIELLADGKSDGSGIYVCGDWNSKLQGWVQGAFQSVDDVFQSAGF